MSSTGGGAAGRLSDSPPDRAPSSENNGSTEAGATVTGKAPGNDNGAVGANAGASPSPAAGAAGAP